LRSKALTLNGEGFYPVGQHSISIHSSGDLLLFNNGLGSLHSPAGAATGQTRTFSTVNRYHIDAPRMEATETWRYEHGRSIYSDICSSAREGSGGSTLITYSAADGRTKSRVVAISSQQEVLFEFEYPSPGCQHLWNTSIVPLDHLTYE
jgi:hypothetical protein